MNRPDRPRAFLRGTSPDVLKAQIEQFFAGPHAGFYAEQALDALRGKDSGKDRGVEIIATSVKDCYEMALQKPSLYVGEMADMYMKQELDQHRFTPVVVTEEEFERLIASGAQGVAFETPQLPESSKKPRRKRSRRSSI